MVIFNVSVNELLPQFNHELRLPFLNTILYAGYLHGQGDYLTYSNVDIGVQPPFYIKLARQLQVMPGRAQCPMPNAQGPMPKAQGPRPNAQCPVPNAQCPMPNAQMPNAQCPMPYAHARCR